MRPGPRPESLSPSSPADEAALVEDFQKMIGVAFAPLQTWAPAAVHCR